MINKDDMKKAQRDLFDFLENNIKKKHKNLVLECFLKFKNRTTFEKTMKRILKGKDEFECEEYKMTFPVLEYIIDELQKLKKKKKIKKKEPEEKSKKEKPKNKPKPKKKSEKLNKEDCKKWEENKKNVKNGKVININNGKEIKYTKKDGNLTKKVMDINKECEKIKSKKSPKKLPKKKSEKKTPPLPKNLRKSPLTPKPIKSKKKLSPDVDEDECKTQDDCDSKCCKDNQCVSGSICKKEQEQERDEANFKKQMIKNNKKAKNLRKSYEHFEMKVIGHIKDLTSQMGRNNLKKILFKKKKLEKKMLSLYNSKFAGTSQIFVINIIPDEIQRHLDFLNQRIKFLTPEPQKSKTPIPEPEDSPGTLFERYYVQLMDSNPPSSLLDKIVRKYNIQFDFESPPNRYQKMIAISENFKAVNDPRIQKYINGSGIPDTVVNEMSTFSDEEIANLGEVEEIVESLPKKKSKLVVNTRNISPLQTNFKSKTPSKSKSHSKTHQKILDDLKNNQLNQEDMDKILKKLNLKTQKEYLKELILIGLNKL